MTDRAWEPGEEVMRKSKLIGHTDAMHHEDNKSYIAKEAMGCIDAMSYATCQMERIIFRDGTGS